MGNFNAEVMKVIRTELTLRGKGIEGDPIRRIIEFWSLDGRLLAEVDTWKQEHD